MSRRRNRGKKSMRRKVNSNSRNIAMLKNSIERKFSNATPLAAEGCDTAGNTTHLSIVNQGDNGGQRIGDQITVRILMIRGVIDNTNGTPVDAICRLMVYKNKIPNGVTQVIADEVLDAATINSMRDWPKKEIYKVYYDNTFSLDTSLHSKIPFKIRVSGLNSKTTYQGSGAGQADAMTNHYYFSMFSDQAAGANAPTIDATFRFTFDDA